MVVPPLAHAFEVSDVATENVLDAWESHNREALIELACTVQSGRTFRAREVNLEVGGLRLASVQGTPHAVSRDASTISARPSSAIGVYAAIRGESVVEHDGKRLVVRPGEVLVCDLDQPLQRRFDHGLHELAVVVPRDDVQSLTELKAVDPVVLTALGPTADTYAKALVRIVGRAVVGAACHPADQQAVVELVSVMASAGTASLPLAHRAVARAHIDDHLSDPSLSATDVAGGAGISERHLSRLFAQIGTSVPRYVLARRLDTAYALLRDSGHTGQLTTDIATRCGFTSMSYFSQAFKCRFGVTAGMVRRGVVGEVLEEAQAG